MTRWEIFAIVATALGVAEVIRLVVEKLLNKKSNGIANTKDEFAVMKERQEFADKEITRLNRQQIENSRRISRLYTFLADLTRQTCSKKDCKMRDLIAIDFDSIEVGIDEEQDEETERQ